MVNPVGPCLWTIDRIQLAEAAAKDPPTFFPPSSDTPSPSPHLTPTCSFSTDPVPSPPPTPTLSLTPEPIAKPRLYQRVTQRAAAALNTVAAPVSCLFRPPAPHSLPHYLAQWEHLRPILAMTATWFLAETILGLYQAAINKRMGAALGVSTVLIPAPHAQLVQHQCFSTTAVRGAR